MASFAREAEIICVDEHGRQRAKIRIVQNDSKSPSIRLLSLSEATEFGEEQVQILEGCGYDFELHANDGNLSVQPSGLVRPNAIRSTLGRIETGIETGLLQITLGSTVTGSVIARAAVEM